MKVSSGIQAATIANGAAISSEIDLRGYRTAGIIMPSAWTAASIGIQVSNKSGGTLVPLYDGSGNLVEYTGDVDLAVSLGTNVAAWDFIKLWSETSGTGVNQGAAREILVNVKA